MIAKRAVVLGTSGHARVCVELLEADPSVELVGCLGGADPASPLPVLGGDELLPQLIADGVRHAFVAIGDNRRRCLVSSTVRDLGFELLTAIAPSAVVSRRASVGAGTAVMAGAVINPGALIGRGAIVNTGARVDHDCVLGDWAHVAPGTALAGNVELDEGAMMGVGSCARPGVRVGAWTTVGAGAAVVHDLPAGVVAVGIPARPRPADAGRDRGA